MICEERPWHSLFTHYQQLKAQGSRNAQKAALSFVTENIQKKKELSLGHLHVCFSFLGFRCPRLPQRATNPATAQGAWAALTCHFQLQTEQTVTLSPNHNGEGQGKWIWPTEHLLTAFNCGKVDIVAINNPFIDPNYMAYIFSMNPPMANFMA